MTALSIASAPTTETEAPANIGLLRFITAGSVDDGKSTLIGRLLYDSKSLHADQVSAIEQSSLKRGLSEVDLSLLTDGLQAEREQGITIDVAYRYFSTPKRKFIIGDAPGHEQYTRNMVTAASTAELAVILVDARKGLATQTRRHSYLAHLLGVKHIVLAINKMDSVDWQQDIYRQIVSDYQEFAEALGLSNIVAIPMSALKGDNVVDASTAMSWYQGSTLLDYLQTVSTVADVSNKALRMPVQRVVRVMLGNAATQTTGDDVEFRGYQGTLAEGSLQCGDTVMVLPAWRSSQVRSLKLAGKSVKKAVAGSAVVVELEDEIDISRGDIIVGNDQPPKVTRELDADICWLAEQPLNPKAKYLIKHTTRTVKGLFGELHYKINVNTLEQHPQPEAVHMNDIVRVQIKLQQALFVDTYAENKVTGSFIVIDESSLATVAAGVIV
ncbi:hypothetical protein JCM14076_15380 [Methylosoma difficile]